MFETLAHCHYTDTCRQLLALKRAARYQPVMQTSSAHCVGEYVGCLYAFADVLGAGLRHNQCSRLEAPVVWGSMLDTHTPPLRTCCELACDAGSPLVELPVDFAFTWWECRCDCVWSLLAGAYLYTGDKTRVEDSDVSAGWLALGPVACSINIRWTCDLVWC
jgi:hypothetical protein